MSELDKLENEVNALQDSVLSSAENFYKSSPEITLIKPEPDPEILGLMIMLVGGFFQSITPNWDVTEDEVTNLAGCYCKVLDKYYPDLKIGVELEALGTTAYTVLPRIKNKIPRTVKDVTPGKESKSGQKKSQFPPEGKINE